MACDAQSLLAAATARGYQKLSLRQIRECTAYLAGVYTISGNHPLVTAWLANVASNGGAAPSPGTIAALNTFCKGLDSDGLTSKMVSVCPFVPDNLIAAITPIITPPGIKIWTNNGFVGADLNTDGLIGDGATKWLDTQVAPAGNIPSNQHGGISILTFASPNGAAEEFDFGSWSADNFTAQMNLRIEWVNGNGYYVDYMANSEIVGGPVGISVGWTSGNREAGGGGLNSLYQTDTANYGGVDQVVAQAAGASVSVLPATSCYLFAAQDIDNPGTAVFWSTKQYSFAAITVGLTIADDQLFYARVFALRVALGGGSV